MLERIPNKEHYWKDKRLTLRKKPAEYYGGIPAIAILSPEDKGQLGTYDRYNRRYREVKHLDLKGVLDDTIYKSSQVMGICYQCGCKIFYYEKPGEDIDYPKICPLGHPAYEEL